MSLLRKWRDTLSGVLLALALTGCVGAPPGIVPVTGFDVDRYLGTWYEIARLDHSFERGLSDVTATYARRDDGGLAVLNRGFDAEKGAWREAQGRAYFLEDAGTASLKVTFFWPFYGGYHVIALDREGYRHALVAGPGRDYLWILARDKRLPEATLERLLAVARRNGFDANALIFVTHDRE
jgi:apolipoprotein D and lipocalin family protein